jgi:hypothetical protein
LVRRVPPAKAVVDRQDDGASFPVIVGIGGSARSRKMPLNSAQAAFCSRREGVGREKVALPARDAFA